MTNFLDQVTSGPSNEGQKIIIAGVEGIGKTTLACSTPGALLVPLEQGYASLPVSKTPMLTTWEQVIDFCDEIEAGAKSGKVLQGSSIVWDSGTALERLIHDYVIRSDPKYKAGNATKLNMENSHDGYGKAYQLANEQFARWLRYADMMTKYGKINWVMTCHVFASRVQDPAHGEYDTWDLLLHSPKNNKNYGKREMATQWADFIGFMYEPMFVQKSAEGETVKRGIASNSGRMVAVERTPSWVAKNRHNMSGSLQIPKPAEGSGIDPAVWNAIAGPMYHYSGINVYNYAQQKG